MIEFLFKSLKNFKGILISCAFLALFAIFYFENQADDKTKSEELQRLPSSSAMLYFRGFSMVENNGYHVVKIEADEFMLIPKKYYIFNFKPFTEIVLKNAKITTYKNKDEYKIEELGPARDEHRFSFPKIEMPHNIFGQNSTTMTSGVQLKGFIWLIMEGENELFKCQAKNAYFSTNKSEVALDDLELENIQLGKRITAKKGELDLNSNLVKITTSSIRQAHGVQILGKALHLDMNLNPIPF